MVCLKLPVIEPCIHSPWNLKAKGVICVECCYTRNFTNNLFFFLQKMVNGGKVDFWTCVNFSSDYANMSEDFCKELVKMCNSKGMVCCVVS